jgi:iron(III) transport system substrate-binding protein
VRTRLPFLCAVLVWVGVTGCRNGGRPQVIVYCAQDQEYAEPIFRDFTRTTGIEVRAVYDSEAVKTVGIANRLLAERGRPVCDVFWNNEELRTRQLAARGVFRRTNGWFAFGYRSRRLVINTNLVSRAKAPHSLEALTNAAWHGKVVLAYPLFGTTATHFLCLRQAWGESRWTTWCRALDANRVANRPFLVDGNSVVVNLVGKGEAGVGLTDSDDIADGRQEGFPVAALPLDAESLLIPNTVGIVRGAPHPKAAQRLADYLRSPAVVARLVAAHALEGSDVRQVATQTLEVDWSKVLADLTSGTAALKAIFLRQ